MYNVTMELVTLLSQPENFLKAIVVIAGFIAMITDMKWGKIYNWLTFPLILGGWFFNFYFFGLSGLGYSFAGTVLGIFLYFILAIIGVIGMGDVKLMGAVGSLCGSTFVLNTFLYTSVLGIPHAFLIQFLNYGRDAIPMFITSFTTKAFLDKAIQEENKNNKKNYRFLLGIDIFLATVITCFYMIRIKF